jgi:hypothetical protein
VAVTMPVVKVGTPKVEKVDVAPLLVAQIPMDAGITIAGFVLVKVTVIGASVATLSPTLNRLPEV